MKRVAVLGSTGSIGTSTLTVLDSLRDRMEPAAFTAHRNWEQLAEQCRQFRPRWAVLADESLREICRLEEFPKETEVLFGPESIERIAADDAVDVVITGISGAAGLHGTWAAVESGKIVGIANKETLVVAGPLIMDLAERSGAVLIPVDSEHSAVFQAIRTGQRSEVGGQRSDVGGQRSDVGGQRSEVGGQRSEVGGQRSEVGDRRSEDQSAIRNPQSAIETTHHSPLPPSPPHPLTPSRLSAGPEVRRIILTASGGPFRGWSAERLAEVTPEMALAHPTWDMGPKVTIDSATLMNKALEVIEARWLFDLTVDQIEVVVHPQSIVHSLVEFIDGAVIGQLSPPDMMLPIQYALTFPERTDGPSPRLDWWQAFSLEFAPPDRVAFPALDLGFEVARRGGTSGAVLNAANEAAVERFLAGELPFPHIPRACRAVLDAHKFDANPTLTELMRLDAWARKEIRRWT